MNKDKKKKEEAKKQAILGLKIARYALSENVELTIKSLRENADKAGCSLEQIGTREQELEALLVAGYKNEALEISSRWRKEGFVKKPKDSVGYLRRCIANAGCIPEDFGLTEELLRKICV
ncbi:MAG: hypothetical protein WC242_03615 [Candidatus Paceibacterota bacterium]|jgi:hypothetical protein